MPVNKRRSFWVIASLIVCCMSIGLLLLLQSIHARSIELEKSRLEAQSMEFAYAFQSSAQAYGRFLTNVQYSLTSAPLHEGGSLVDQWNITIANPEFASTRIVRMIPVESDTLLGSKIENAIKEHRGGIEVRAFAQSNGLTLVAIPAAHYSASGSPDIASVIGVDLVFTDWLREVQRLATSYAVDVHAFVAPTPVPIAEMQPSMRWNKDSLHIAMQIMGQRVELVFTPSAQLTSSATISQAVPWGLVISGLVLLIAWLIFLRMRETELVDSGQRYKEQAHKGWLRYFAFLNHPLIPAAELDRENGYFHKPSPRLSQLLGYKADELQRLTIASITHPDDLVKLQHPDILPSEDAHYLYEKISDLRLQHNLGYPVWVDLLRIRYTPSSLENTKHTLTDRDIMVLHDKSQSKLLQNQLQRRIEKNEAIFEQLPVGLCIADTEQHIHFINERFKSYSLWQGANPLTLDDWWLALNQAGSPKTTHERWQQQVSASITRSGMLETIEIHLHSRQQDQHRVLELSGIVLDDQIVLTLVDVSIHKKAEDDIRLLAFYDLTTELPNRKLLLDRLQQACISSMHHPRYGALLLLKLEQLRTLRDGKNNAQADAILKETVQRIRPLLPADHTIARIDTDTFAILLNALALEEEMAVHMCEQIGSSVLQAIQQPYTLAERSLHLSTCIGATLFKGTRHSAEDLLGRAQIARRQSAQNGHNTVHFFDPQIQENASARAALERNIKAGMAMSEFVLYYQPQVEKYNFIGAEVLLRWRHGEVFVSPDKFINTAEQSNLILPLGNWVLHQACKQLAQWAERSETAHLTLSVNISPKQFKHAQFVDTVIQAIANTGAPARQLVIELTESMLFEDIDSAIARMGPLRAHGVGFSLDDFGMGYSSLSDLQRLPLTELKIDRSFIKDIDHNANDARMVRSIISLGHSMDLRVIAEGVETQAQIDYLIDSGCMRWQGYFIGKPQPIERLEQLMHEQIPFSLRGGQP